MTTHDVSATPAPNPPANPPHNPPGDPATPALDWATAEDAYHIINALLHHVQVSNDLIATMAGSLGESATQQVTETLAWANYLAQRKMMEHLQVEIQKFSLTMIELSKNRPDRPEEHAEVE